MNWKLRETKDERERETERKRERDRERKRERERKEKNMNEAFKNDSLWFHTYSMYIEFQ
jgi:hypothetical protein